MMQRENMTLSSDMQRHIANWEQVHSTRPWGLYPSEDLIRFVTRRYRDAADRSAIRIIDIGCGPGANLTYLGREGFMLAGIDASTTALKNAKERFRAAGLEFDDRSLDLCQGNFAELPWPDESFDVAIDMESIYANPMEIIRACVGEAHRVLKPGAVFFGKAFGTETTGYGTGEIYEPNTSRNPVGGPCGGFGFAHFFTREEIEDVFSGFSELSIDWLHRTDRGESISIFEWIVTAVK